jgi:hypothetical protein
MLDVVTTKRSMAERVSLQSAQMIVMATMADTAEMRDELLDFARRMARQARTAGPVEAVLGEEEGVSAPRRTFSAAAAAS